MIGAVAYFLANLAEALVMGIPCWVVLGALAAFIHRRQLRALFTRKA